MPQDRDWAKQSHYYTKIIILKREQKLWKWRNILRGKHYGEQYGGSLKN